ncbi:hypothetical protein ACFLTL_02155 [Chloroflexota bacterium]
MSRTVGIIGFITFAVGLLLALVGGIVAPANGTIILVLVVLGIIVGALNIITREILALLVATVALIVVGTIGFDPLNDLITGLGTTINEIVYYLARLMAPAAVIAAIRTLVRVGFPVAK